MKKTIFTVFLSILIINTFAEKVKILAAESISSAVLVYAAKKLDDVDIELFKDHTQAHARFLKGEIDILATGFSVGMIFYKKDKDIRLLGSYASGLSYLLTNEKKVDSFSDIIGGRIFLPFENSPIDQITKFFLKKENLEIREDITLLYKPFNFSYPIFERGKAEAGVYIEPFISRLEKNENIYISIKYEDLWRKYTDKKDWNYPQLAILSKNEWVENNKKFIKKFYKEINSGIKLLKKDKEKFLSFVEGAFEFPKGVLESSLDNTIFILDKGKILKDKTISYYKILDIPIDDEYEKTFLHTLKIHF